MESIITVKKLKKDEARGKLLELLKAGLTHVKDQRPHALSGGQQQHILLQKH